jgi:hypothetical protein
MLGRAEVAFMTAWSDMIIRRIEGKPVTTGCVRAATAAALLGALLIVQPVVAQESGRVTVDVEECLELDSPAARGACFAAQVDQALEDGSTVEAAAESRKGEAGGNRGAASPGARGATAAQSAPARSTAAPASRSSGIFDTTPDQDTEYFGTIVDLRETVPNNYIITLDTGQVWEQAEPRRYPLSTGLEVRIYPTRWGQQYRLTSEEHGGQIKVKLRN